MRERKLKVGVYGFTGCAGDQLSIIHSEDELLDFFSSVDVCSFSMAQRNNKEEDLDIAFIEGSITTEEQKKKLVEIDSRSATIVAIGICACFGGIQSMKVGEDDWKKRFNAVYGENPPKIVTAFESRPIDDFVTVDYYIPGCPIAKDQFQRAFSRLIHGNPPELCGFPVCTECKWKENECLLLKDIPCIGPLTTAGCGAICPSHNLPCVGCWGLYEEANCGAEYRLLLEKGFDMNEIKRRMRSFGGTKVLAHIEQLGELK